METSESLRTGRLSVVLPAYNEEESVPLAADVIGDLLTQAGIDHELIFVNDGSRDHTWRAIQEPEEETMIAVAQLEDFQAMPLYPADGSVRMLDGRVVVKIQEEYTPKSDYELAYENRR